MSSLVMSRRVLSAVCLLFAAPVAARTQPTISTLPAWNGRDILGGIGLPGSSAVGQTFAAPGAGRAMTGFSLYLSADHVSGDPGDLLFRGYLMAWDGTRATGPVLYESEVRNGHPVQDDPTRYDFDFAPVGLTSGSNYVFFLSRLGLADRMGPEPNSANDFGFLREDTYVGGQLVFFNILDDHGDDPSRLTLDPWGHRPELDMAFEARFGGPTTTTPEPASLALAAAGVLALGGARAARRRARGA